MKGCGASDFLGILVPLHTPLIFWKQVTVISCFVALLFYYKKTLKFLQFWFKVSSKISGKLVLRQHQIKLVSARSVRIYLFLKLQDVSTEKGVYF